MDYRHPNVAELVKRMREVPERLILVTGPRQTGKTTAVLQALNEVGLPSKYVAVDQLDRTAFLEVPGDGAAEVPSLERRDTHWLLRVWERARTDATRSERGFILVLDEIQQIPNWSGVVKGLWDADRRNGLSLRVAILGSAPLLLQKDLGETLVGRFEALQFTHWSFSEMHEAFGFDLDTYVYFGGSPGAARIRDPIRWRQHVRTALVEPVIQRDVLGITRVDKPTLLRRVFEFGSQRSGQVFSYNRMLGQLHDAGNTTTLARYLELLSAVGLLAGIEKYSGSFVQIKRSSPKLNVLNTAFAGAYSGFTFTQARADRTFWGRLVESAVGAHLLNTGWIDGTQVYYWSAGDAEVDFVLRRGPHLVAIEVKSGRQLRGARGLHTFSRKYPHARSLVVGADGVPLSDFLRVPAGQWAEE